MWKNRLILLLLGELLPLVLVDIRRKNTPRRRNITRSAPAALHLQPTCSIRGMKLVSRHAERCFSADSQDQPRITAKVVSQLTGLFGTALAGNSLNKAAATGGTPDDSNYLTAASLPGQVLLGEKASDASVLVVHPGRCTHGSDGDAHLPEQRRPSTMPPMALALLTPRSDISLACVWWLIQVPTVSGSTSVITGLHLLPPLLA